MTFMAFDKLASSCISELSRGAKDRAGGGAGS